MKNPYFWVTYFVAVIGAIGYCPFQISSSYSKGDIGHMLSSITLWVFFVFIVLVTDYKLISCQVYKMFQEKKDESKD